MTFSAGPITVVLRDGRQFTYPADSSPAVCLDDLRAHGVRHASEIAMTVHVIHREPHIVVVDHSVGDR